MAEEEMEPPTGGFCAQQMAILGCLKDAVVGIFSSKEEDKDNPIFGLYDVREVVATAGSGLVWKVHDAIQKTDGKKCSVFLFDQRDANQSNKTEKTKVIAALKDAIAILQSNTLLNSVEVWHRLEEGPNLLAFATEPVTTTLQNIFEYHKEEIEFLTMTSWPIKMVQPYDSSLHPPLTTHGLPPYAKEYYFLDLECRYGAIQIIDALCYLHNIVKMVHGNVCPSNVVITADGTWKLIGFELSHSEIETDGQKNIFSDMYSLGLLILALYNCGRPILNAEGSHVQHFEEITDVNMRAAEVMQRMSPSLQEVVRRMLGREFSPRPPLSILLYTKYFSGYLSDGAIRLLQFLKQYSNTSAREKADFIKNIKKEHLDLVPKKMLIDRVFNTLKPDLTNPSLLAVITPVVIQIIRLETEENFSNIIYPVMRKIYTVESLIAENNASIIPYINGFGIILSKCISNGVIRQELISVLVHALEIPVLWHAAIAAVRNTAVWISDEILLKECLPRVHDIMIKSNNQDNDISLSTINLFEHLIGRVDRVHLYAFIVPSIQALGLVEPTVISSVVNLLHLMVNDNRLGLNNTQLVANILACVAANAENNTDNQLAITVTEILQSMMEMLEREQNSLLEENNSLMAQRQRSLDGTIQFCIPNLRVERKLTSVGMAHKYFALAAEQANSRSDSVAGNIRTFLTTQRTGMTQWFFGSNDSTNSNNKNVAGPSGIYNAAASSGRGISGNLLRVESVLPSHRSSDNSLMAPKIKIVPSCASTPGGTPVGSRAILSACCHSSISPQKHQSPHAHLSPPPEVHGRGRDYGSGSNFSMATSRPAGGSLAGSKTQHLDTSRKNSGASVKSEESAQPTRVAARRSVSARSSPVQDNRGRGPLQDNRPSPCATRASSAASIASAPRASTSGASTTRVSTHAGTSSASTAVTQPRGRNYGIRRLPIMGSGAPPIRSPRRKLPNIHRRMNTNITAQAEVVANNVAHNINDMAEVVSNAIPNYATVTRMSTRSIRLFHNPLH